MIEPESSRYRWSELSNSRKNKIDFVPIYSQLDTLIYRGKILNLRKGLITNQDYSKFHAKPPRRKAIQSYKFYLEKPSFLSKFKINLDAFSF